MKRIYLFIIIFSIVLKFEAFSQTDSLINIYSKYFETPYISDGQTYRAMLSEDETAEFRMTFYGGSTYRLISFSTLKNEKVNYRVYDKERNILFSSEDYKNPPYWDFKFESTQDCIVEAELVTKKQESGVLVMLVGFKQL